MAEVPRCEYEECSEYAVHYCECTGEPLFLCERDTFQHLKFLSEQRHQIKKVSGESKEEHANLGCVVGGCRNVPQVYCVCSGHQILCEQHVISHIRENGNHSMEVLFHELTNTEKEAVHWNYTVLQKAYVDYKTLQLKSLNEKLVYIDQKTQEYTAKMNKKKKLIEQKCVKSLYCVKREFDRLLEELAEVKEKGVPSIGSNRLCKKLIELKKEETEVHAASIVDRIKSVLGENSSEDLAAAIVYLEEPILGLLANGLHLLENNKWNTPSFLNDAILRYFIDKQHDENVKSNLLSIALSCRVSDNYIQAARNSLEVLRALGQDLKSFSIDDVLDKCKINLANTQKSTMKEPRQLKTGKQSVYCIDFSPSGELVAVGLSDGNIILYNLCTYNKCREFTRNHVKIRFLSFSFDSKCIASSNFTRGVDVWDIVGYKKKWSFDPSNASLKAMVCSPVEDLMVCNGECGAIMGFGLGDGQSVRFYSHLGDITALCLSYDGSRIISAGEDLVIKIWDKNTQTMLFEINKQMETIVELAVARTGNLVVLGGEKSVMLVTFDTQVTQKEVDISEMSVCCLAFSANDDELICGTKEGKILLFDIAMGTLKKLKWHKYQNPISCVRVSRNADYFASASRNIINISEIVSNQRD